MSDLVVVADTHLVRRDAELDAFVRFLDSLADRTAVLYHLGDLFNIWLGKRRFEMAHMRPVLDAFRRLRAAGTSVRLVEGNRDFHVEDGYEDDPFDRIVTEGDAFEFASRRFWVSHGDLVNEADRQYRTWRRFSKSRGVWAAVSLLPSAAGVALGNTLEERLRGTNLRHKSYFPLEACEGYGRRRIAEGFDRVLLGHIHIERTLDLEASGRRGRLVVLPDWHSSHRALRYGADGTEGWLDAAGTGS